MKPSTSQKIKRLKKELGGIQTSHRRPVSEERILSDLEGIKKGIGVEERMKSLILRAPEIQQLQSTGECLIVRPCNPQPMFVKDEVIYFKSKVGLIKNLCPLGSPGERRWVKETWSAWTGGMTDCGEEWDIVEGIIDLEMETPQIEYKATSKCEGPWRPSIHMPQWASRYTVEITGVDCKLVKNISTHEVMRMDIKLPKPWGCEEPLNLPDNFNKWSKGKQEEWLKNEARLTYLCRCKDEQNHLDEFINQWNKKYGKKHPFKSTFAWFATVKKVEGVR
jgi:hypothetical protein